MKKLVIALLLSLIATTCHGATTYTVRSFVTPEDLTITHLEDFRTTIVNGMNSFDGGNIQSGTITPDQLDANAKTTTRWNEAFNDWVYTGFLPSTSGTLATTLPYGVGYIEGERVEHSAESHTFTATKWTYVDLSKNGTYTYIAQNPETAEPAITANSIRICRVSTDGTAVTAIRDDRILSISLDSNQSDMYRDGMFISVVTPDKVFISPGVCYVGNVRVIKDTVTSLNLGTAGDWATGGGGRGTGKYAYVVCDSIGNIYFTETAPNRHNTQGSTAGKLYYSFFNSTYYRALAWFYMNSTGSGNIYRHSYGNFRDCSAPNVVAVTGDNLITSTSTVPVDIADMTAYFYTSGGPMGIDFEAPIENSAANEFMTITITLDGAITKESSATSDGNNDPVPAMVHWFSSDLSQGTHTIKAQWRSVAGALSQTKGQRILRVYEY